MAVAVTAVAVVANVVDAIELLPPINYEPSVVETNLFCRFDNGKTLPSSSGASDSWDFTKYNPDCPNDGWNGYFNTIGCKEDPGNPGEKGPWNYVGVAYVIGSGMTNVFYDFDNIQSADWGWGVFYPTDSNSVDWRCRWLDQYNGYDCGPDPDNTRGGGWIDGDSGVWTDADKQGTGSYPAGNPEVDDSTGGGTGCHLDKRGSLTLDQTDAYDSNGQNLVQDHHCQCNYEFNGDWNDWVYHWIQYAVPKSTVADGNWFVGGRAPSRALDMVSCWMNNPRDMIQLQNALYWARADWSNQLTPETHWSKDPLSTRIYWGWNEIPMDRMSLIEPANHDATMIKLPASLCGNGGGDDTLGCLTGGAAYALERDLDNWANDGYLVPGFDHISDRPGSYIVMAREWVDDFFNWQKYFFCESWTSPNGHWEIVSKPMDSADTYGACYIQAGSTNLNSPAVNV